MGLSAIGMAASSLGLLAPIEGAILQEVIDLLAILNSLRMTLPVRAVGDFKAGDPPASRSDLSAPGVVTLAR